MLLLAVPAALGAAEVTVHASRHGDVLYVEASAEFAADRYRVWQVLTDYNHLADFIPGMRVSRILERRRGTVIVEQKGDVRLLFVTYPIEVTLAIEEFPHGRIVSRAVSGNFLEMHNAYYLEAQQERIRLRYAGRMTPDFLVPPLIGTIMFRKNVEAQFGALVDEILRRQQAAAQPPAQQLPRP
ncbi:MAG: SRPBCC family protein [Pseudomonadota bacterium]